MSETLTRDDLTHPLITHGDFNPTKRTYVTPDDFVHFTQIFFFQTFGICQRTVVLQLLYCTVPVLFLLPVIFFLDSYWYYYYCTVLYRYCTQLHDSGGWVEPTPTTVIVLILTTAHGTDTVLVMIYLLPVPGIVLVLYSWQTCTILIKNGVQSGEGSSLFDFQKNERIIFILVQILRECTQRKKKIMLC